MKKPLEKNDFYRQAIVITGVGLIMIGCLVVLQPFIPALLLAAILCLSTWPAFIHLEKQLAGRTSLAAALMTIALAACFLVPLIFFGGSLAESFSSLVQRISENVQKDGSIAAPAWIGEIPFAGHWLLTMWQTYVADRRQLTQTISDHSGLITPWLIAMGSSIGKGVIDISLGIVIAFFFFQRGQTFVSRLHNLTENFAGPKSRALLELCANTVVGVVYGILGTSLVLAALAAIGFWIAHVPGAPFLGFLTFLLGILPGGIGLVLIPVTIWLFMEGHTGMGAFMALWSFLIVGVLDNVLKPFLISRGAKMPLLLVLLGILGGVAAFGFIGIFIGPALLALATALFIEWSRKGKGAW